MAANKEDAFLHLLQAYASIKDAGQRRDLGATIVDFCKQECAEVDFTSPQVDVDAAADAAIEAPKEDVSE